MPPDPRLIFMGTPDFAVPALEALLAAGYDVVAVYTQPDRPAGRGRQLRPPPVKEVALRAGLPVFQPASLRTDEEQRRLRELAPDLGVVAAYGLILPRAVLEAFPRGVINVHASLLPRWRGAAPVAAAILAGDEQTGISIMLIEPRLDAGPVLARAANPIDPSDTTGSLTTKLARRGADLLVETLPAWLENRIQPEPQDERLATYAPKIEKEAGAIDWREPAEAIWRKVRAFSPSPGAYATWPGGRLKLLEVEPLDLPTATGAEPGLVFVGPNGAPAVWTGQGAVELRRVQREGGRPVGGPEFRRGYPELVGTRLGV